nr:GTP-binding protein rab16 [rats, brain, Peptide Partial, 13 aa] [Rattus sp.]
WATQIKTYSWDNA